MSARANDRLMIIIAAIGLQACSQSVSDDAAIVTEEQVAQRLAAAAPNLPRPGDYELTILQDEETNEMRGCLTSAQLADPLRALVTGGRSDCAFGRFTFRGPQLDAAMVCTSDNGPQSITLNANYRPDGYNLDMTVGSGEDARTIEMKAHRIGACDEEPEQHQGSNT